MSLTLPPHHIDCWIFDLDNTLYPPELELFAQIDQRMGAFIMEIAGCDTAEARMIQKRYFHDHGTTLAGMMRHHAVDPETFLHFVHDVDMGQLVPDAALTAALAALPGKRHIFTNADADYAARILDRRGITHLFDTIIDIRACGYLPKPEFAAYDSLVRLIPGFEPTRSLFVDDMSRNLRPAHALGIATVWLDNGSEAGSRDHDAAHVDHHIDDLTGWLQAVTGRGDRI
jgi:putative hydrolase of the HAD superfamily